MNVKLIDEPAGGDATQNMIAGQVQGVGGFYDHNIALQGQGKSSESVISMLQIPGEVELCRSDLKGVVKSPADWKGRSLGITDTGSSTDFLTQYLATKNGINPADYHEARRRGRRHLHRRDEAEGHRLRHDHRADGVARSSRTAPASSCSTCARLTARVRPWAVPTRPPRCT